MGDTTSNRAYTIANALESRSESLTSYVQDVETQNWPFVTVPNFEVRGENTRRETITEFFAFAPMVMEDDADENNNNWSAYSVANEEWLQESYARVVQTLGADKHYANYAQKHIPEVVYRVEGNWGFVPENSPGPWLPLWQVSPPPPEPYPINFNMLSSPDVAQLVNYIRVHKVPVMSDRLVRHPIFRNMVAQYDLVTPAHDHVEDHGYDPEKDHPGHGHRRALQAPPGVSGSYDETYENQFGHTFVLYPSLITLRMAVKTALMRIIVPSKEYSWDCFVGIGFCQMPCMRVQNHWWR